MLSFPIDFYCEYHKEDPAPEWMTGERMSFCEQPETRENGVLGRTVFLAESWSSSADCSEKRIDTGCEDERSFSHPFFVSI